MKTKLIRLISIVMCIAMMLSLVSCKKTKDNKESKPAATTSEPAPVQDPDIEPDDTADEEGNFDDLDDYDDFEDDTHDDYEEYEYIIDRPDATGSISVGYKKAYDGKDDDDDDFDSDLDDIDDDWDDIGDIDDVVDTDFKNPIQSRGVAVSGTAREINIDNSSNGILFTNWSGYSCCAFPTQSTLIAQQKARDSKAFLEIQAKRYNDIAGRYARLWYQIDWMITSETEKDGGSYKDYANNIYENPDYKNYMNGVYDWNNENFRSTVDYCKVLEEAGTDVYLAFGWKVPLRIQAWFSGDPNYKRESAPKDLKANARAAAALFKHMRNEEGLTNFNVLSFYNEPGRVKKADTNFSDFSTIGDKRVAWYNMAKNAYELFKADDDLKDVKIMGVDYSGNIAVNSIDHVTCYMNEYGSQYLDAFTFHHYISYGNAPGYTDWDTMMDRFTYIVNVYKKPCYITEYYASEVDVTAGDNAWDKNDGFDSTNVAYYIAAANTGVRGIFKWSFVGGFLPDPLYFDPANGLDSSWIRPVDEASVNRVNLTYYQETMINNYIEDDSNVLQIDWKGDDIRASAFTSKNGKEFSLLIEAKEETNNKTFKVKLTKALSVGSLYVYRYNREIEKNAQATIPPLFDTVTLDSSKKSFEYSIDDKYGAYVFTTKAPVKQIELYTTSDEDAVYNYCAKGNTTTIVPKFIDNSETVSNSTVKWEIKRYAGAIVDTNVKRVDKIEQGGDLGSLSVAADGSVTYTPASDAMTGDLIALRCSLVSDPDRFASAIIEIN